MSGSLNKVMLIGNLGDDIKMHHFEDGGCIGRFPLATNENYVNKQTGEKVTNTEWHNVVLWSPLAEIAESYLKKGSQVYIEGKISNRSYEDKDGIKKYVSEVVGRDITLLGRAPDSSGVQAEENKPQESTETVQEDDLPF